MSRGLDETFYFANAEKDSTAQIDTTATDPSVVPVRHTDSTITESGAFGSHDTSSMSRPEMSYLGLRFAEEDEFYNDSEYLQGSSTYKDTNILAGEADASARKWAYKHTLLYFATLFVCALAVIAFESYVYAAINVHKVQEENKYIEMSIYLSLFIFSGVYQVIMTFIGLRTKSMMLLCFLLVFYVMMLIYTGIQYSELNKLMSRLPKGGWKTGILVLMICTIVVIGLCLAVQAWMILYVLRPQVRWLRFKKIGGDYMLKRMYEVFQFHRLLLLFNFFFFVGFTVQFVVILVGNRTSVEFILTVCVLPLTILLLIMADFAATRELLWLTVCCMVLFFGGGAYVVFKVVRLFTKYTLAFNMAIKPGSYFPGRKSLVLFGAITLVLLAVTIITEGYMCYTYGKGLKPFVNGYYRLGSSKTRGRRNLMQQIVSDGEDGEAVRMRDMLDSQSLIID